MTASAETCYINTGHPDFITGHKAMSIIHERIAASKISTISALTADPKAPRPPVVTQLPNSNTTVNGQLIDPNSADNAAGFFGSFFQKKKKPGVLENVFIFSHDSLQPPTVLKASGVLSEREVIETEVISNSLNFKPHQQELLLQSYFNIVKRTIADLVPKSIMLTLVVQTKADLQRELLAELYKKEVFDETLKESESTLSRRKECKKVYSTFELINF